MKPPVIEVCTASAEDALLAQENGAHRIELNSALELGGLTPSRALLEQTLQLVSIPVIVMIRPRPGGFCYSKTEFDIMKRDAQTALKAGAAGIAFGILTPQGAIDEPRCRELVQLALGKEAVFHRAFDWLPHLPAGLETLITLGLCRVLTSGGAATASEGMKVIAALAKQAAGRIEILPGAGITASNAAALLKNTGCRQLHGTFSKTEIDASGKNSAIDFGGGAHPAAFKTLDTGQLIRLKTRLSSIYTE